MLLFGDGGGVCVDGFSLLLVLVLVVMVVAMVRKLNTKHLLRRMVSLNVFIVPAAYGSSKAHAGKPAIRWCGGGGGGDGWS